MERITPFIVMDILAKARQNPDAVHMEVGEPDIPPSPAVKEAFIKAIRDDRFFYTPACGIPELREKIAEHYHVTYGITVSPERIIVTPGTSGAFLIVFSLLRECGARMALADPSYPCYKNFAYFSKIDPHFITVGKETNYELSPDALKEAGNVNSIMVSSPANPTGNIHRKETLMALLDIAREKKICFVSDEIYHGLVYDSQEHTALEFSEDAIVINSFSKAFCMPGLRVGWMILPKSMIRRAEILIQNLLIATNTPSQYACLEAFDYAYLRKTRGMFKERRDYLYAAMGPLFEIEAQPQGAFYIWANISRYSRDALSFCNRLLEEQGVAITPGIDFGDRWTDYVRFAYTRDVAVLAEGVRRIRAFLEKS
ncbi:MAG TPA: aminotransferase class I/II-fold pyridoxal phosphate-dependent enzyme [Dissulfurispiraceae bacterium]|nr:aminotransferase class I/II-fold pyridoxal phosphate-dependent enzyme [Dissulfurispiraceae bacterium]